MSSNNNAKSFQKPVPLGVSCSNSSDFHRTNVCTAGTLGFLVQDQSNNTFVVSCAHVFVGIDPSFNLPNSTQIGDIIAQPGDLDAGCSLTNINNSVARLYKWETINQQTNQTAVDVALARIIANKVTAFNTIQGLGIPYQIDTFSAPGTVKIGIVVKKSGRTTGVTYGKIKYIYTDCKIMYDTPTGEDYALEFRDLVVIASNKFSQAGDGGSLVVSGNCQPMGLLFANTDNFSFAYMIKSVLRRIDALMKTKVTIIGTPKKFICPTPYPQLSLAIRAKYTLKKILVQHPDDYIGIGLAEDDINNLLLVAFIHSTSRHIPSYIPSEVDGFKVVVEFMKELPRAC